MPPEPTEPTSGPPDAGAPNSGRPEEPPLGAIGAPGRGLALAFATGLGSGLLPKAPGTFGSTLAIPIFVLFSPSSFDLQLVTWLGLLGIGIWSAEIAGQAFGVEDDGRIVIDEIVGLWLTYLPLVPLGAALGFTIGPANWSAPPSLALLVTGFVAFRCFDIGKPGPVGWAERRYQGGIGVMMDDVIAGAFAAVVLSLVAFALSAAGLLTAEFLTTGFPGGGA